MGRIFYAFIDRIKHRCVCVCVENFNQLKFIPSCNSSSFPINSFAYHEYKAYKSILSYVPLGMSRESLKKTTRRWDIGHQSITYAHSSSSIPIHPLISFAKMKIIQPFEIARTQNTKIRDKRTIL